MGKIKEVRRVCRRCGTEWFLPKALAKEKAPSSLQVAGKKMQASKMNLTPIGWLSKGRRQAEAQAAEEQREKVLGRSQCPGCGSTDFDQQKA